MEKIVFFMSLWLIFFCVLVVKGGLKGRKNPIDQLKYCLRIHLLTD